MNRNDFTHPLPLRSVRVTDGFWGSYQRRVLDKVIPYQWEALNDRVHGADKSGCISFGGKKYDLGVKYAGRVVDVVFDPANIETLTIEVQGETPFLARKVQVGEHVRPRPKRPEADIEADHSRLLSAVTKKYKANTVERRRAISYSSEIEKDR